MTPEQKQVVELHQSGMTLRDVADNLGISYKSARSRWERAQKWIEADPAIRNTAQQIGIADVSRLSHYWDKVELPDGRSVSAFIKNDVSTEVTAIEEQVASAIEAIERAKPVASYISRPSQTDDSLMGVIMQFDAHIGLSMPNMDLDKAVQRVVDATCSVIDQMPASGLLLFGNGGDMTHQNDDSNQTPQSKHPLPISGRYIDASDAALDMRIYCAEYAAKKFDRVETFELKGNHDPHTAMILRSSMIKKFDDNDRIKPHTSKDVTWYEREFGNNLFTAHHGDIRRGAKDIALGLQNKYRVERGRCAHHEHHTGHLHHVKEMRLDVGGVMLCQHSALTVKSNYDKDNLYDGASILQGITFRSKGGRKGTVEEYLE